MSFEGKETEGKDADKESAASSGAAAVSEGKDADDGSVILELDSSQFSQASHPEPNLVQKLLEYFYALFDQPDMQKFLDGHLKKFDQDRDNYVNKGHTLEQWEVYEQYKKIVEGKLETFARDQGFDSAFECFAKIQELVSEDEEKAKEQRKAIVQQIRQQQKAMRQAIEDQRRKVSGTSGDVEGKDAEVEDASGGGGGRGDDADQDATDEASAKATEELIMFFYQPVTLSKLIDTVLNMTEYPMFSYIMRSRVQMMKLMSQFEGLVAAMEDLQVQDAEEGDDGRKGEGVQEGEGDKLKLEGKDADEEDGHTPNANFEGKE